MKRRNTAKPSKLLQGLMGIKKPTREEKYRAALAGDALAVEWLHFDKPELDDKLELLLNLCRDGAHRPLVRALVLEMLFDHPRRIHAEVPGSRDILVELMDYAAYEHHPDLPERLTLYRGTSGLTPEVAKTGYFWSPSQDAAATYAAVSAIQRGKEPLLIRAEVSRSDVAVFFDPHAGARAEYIKPGDPLGSWQAILIDSPLRVTEVEIPDMEARRAGFWAGQEDLAEIVTGDGMQRIVKRIRKRMREVGYEP